jgi:integrase
MAEVSVRRIVADARACFNACAKRHRDKLPPTLRDVIRDGLAVPKGSVVENFREPQILSDADVRLVVDSAGQIDAEQGWGGDLARMVLVLASTGARLSQAARLKVADVDSVKQRIMMPVSRKGGGEKRVSHHAVPVGPDLIAALQPLLNGRKGTDPLLLRPRWRRAAGVPGSGRGVLEVYERGPWRAASEITTPWKAVVARADLSRQFVCYSLRHSSIVRLLRAGLPTQLVAKLHDTSEPMIASHYGRFIETALDDLARSALIPMVTAPVAKLREVKG